MTMRNILDPLLAAISAAIAVVLWQAYYRAEPLAFVVVIITIASGLSAVLTNQIAKAGWSMLQRGLLGGILMACFVILGYTVKYSLGL